MPLTLGMTGCLSMNLTGNNARIDLQTRSNSSKMMESIAIWSSKMLKLMTLGEGCVKVHRAVLTISPQSARLLAAHTRPPDASLGGEPKQGRMHSMRRLMILAVAVLAGGPVSADKMTPHANGGGMVCNSTLEYWSNPYHGHPPASVANVYIGPSSTVCGPNVSSGSPRIIRSEIQGGYIAGNAVVKDSVLKSVSATGTFIGGSARVVDSVISDGGNVDGNARIIGSRLQYSYIGGGAKVFNSSVHSGGKVSGNAVVRDSIVSGKVSGSAVVANGSVIRSGGAVDCGRWIGVTVSTDRTGKCGRNGKTSKSGGSGGVGDLLSNPINPENTETED